LKRESLKKKKRTKKAIASGCGGSRLKLVKAINQADLFFSLHRFLTVTLYPLSASRIAVAAPMPLVAPVIRMTLPAMLMACSPLGWVQRYNGRKKGQSRVVDSPGNCWRRLVYGSHIGAFRFRAAHCLPRLYRSSVLSKRNSVIGPHRAGPRYLGVHTMATGTGKWFNGTKGYGFIQPDDGSKDVFVHITAVERAGMDTLVEGQKVNYDLVSERGKTAAANLKAG